MVENMEDNRGKDTLRNRIGKKMCLTRTYDNNR